MNDKEFINLLQKYSREVTCEIDCIVKAYKNIISCIMDIRSVLADKIKDEIEGQARKNVMDDICNDASLLRDFESGYNEIIKVLTAKEMYIESKEDTNIGDKDSGENKIPVFLIADKICPVCMKEVEYAPIIYQNRKNQSTTLRGYRCSECNKKFVLDTDLVDFTDANIDLITNFYNRVSLHDVIVLSNINKCSKHNHDIEDVVGILLTVSNEGTIVEEEANLIYCNNCKKYTILKSEYEKIKGTPLCEIIDETRTSNSNPEFDYCDKGGSKLARHGYNVNCVDKLTEIQRETILGIQLVSGSMTKGEIMSYIDSNIENGMKRENSKKNWSQAINKWKNDKEYVRNFNLDSFSKRININRFILKYSVKR